MTRERKQYDVDPDGLSQKDMEFVLIFHNQVRFNPVLLCHMPYAILSYCLTVLLSFNPILLCHMPYAICHTVLLSYCLLIIYFTLSTVLFSTDQFISESGALPGRKEGEFAHPGGPSLGDNIICQLFFTETPEGGINLGRNKLGTPCQKRLYE
jgi:hypothetical protein